MVVGLEDDDYLTFLNDQIENNDKLIDPLYKMFLDHLREDGKAYVFEMANGDHDLHAVVEYEREGVSEENELDTHVSSKKNLFAGSRHFVINKSPLERGPGLQAGQVSDNSFALNCQSECSLLDESYQIFLSHAKVEGNSVILQYNSIFVTYEEDTETPTASDDIEIVDERGLVPYKSTQPSDLTVYEDDHSSIIPLEHSNLSDFKQKLMAVLDKPYDQNEYEELLREATDRKPLNKQKHLRSMSISYPTKQVGLSYLDHFPDLGIQFASADSHRRLILLRGFFFWLKAPHVSHLGPMFCKDAAYLFELNLSHEGSFMPWVSSSDAVEAIDYEIIPPLEIARDES